MHVRLVSEDIDEVDHALVDRREEAFRIGITGRHRVVYAFLELLAPDCNRAAGREPPIQCRNELSVRALRTRVEEFAMIEGSVGLVQDMERELERDLIEGAIPAKAGDRARIRLVIQ